MGTITWLRPNEAPKVEEASAPPSLEKMQEFVGGYIELVRILGPKNTPEQMIVNEEGHLNGLELNPVATEHYHRLTLNTRGARPGATIVGPAIVLEGSDVWLD